MVDSSLPPDIMDEIRALRTEVELLKRAPRWRGAVLPFVVLGAVRDFGFTSFDVTEFADFFRCDTVITAPIFDYDIQTTDFYATTTPTSVDWQITATPYFDPGGGDFSPVVIASGTSAGTTQFSGTVDLLDPAALGPAAMFRFARFDFECKRTGGSGDGAALRLVRPPLLRLPE